MRYIQNISREQTRLLPYSVEEMVEETSPVRVIHAYVDSLPMETLGFERAEPAQTGRPAYDPRDLLKLYIYCVIYIIHILYSSIYNHQYITHRHISQVIIALCRSFARTARNLWPFLKTESRCSVTAQ